jgi:hypothetical protein
MDVGIPGQILFGLAATYLVATVSESYLHRFVGHASVKARRYWSKHPRLFGHLLRVHYRHAVVHHGLTFRLDHITQFENSAENAAVDRFVAHQRDSRIQEESYGLTIGLRGLVTYNLTVVPIVPIVCILTGPWALAGALPLLTVAPVLAMLIHPYLHRDHEAATREAPALVALLLKTRYFRALSRHHFLHHKYPNCNFNLLLGGDYPLGTHRSPSVEDLSEMAAIGILIDDRKRYRR